MLSLKVKTRSLTGKKTKELRNKGLLPAVLYGPAIKQALNLEVEGKEFLKIFAVAGQTSLLQLEIEAQKKPYLVLVHDLQRNYLNSTISHIDFYQPSATKEIKVTVPLVFEGESGAVKSLGAVLLKNIQEVQVQALPQNLPHEIRVDISSLNELGKTILVKDLKLMEGVKILKNPDEIIVQAQEMEKIEEELKKAVEEKVEEVKVIEKEKKKEELPEDK